MIELYAEKINYLSLLPVHFILRIKLNFDCETEVAVSKFLGCIGGVGLGIRVSSRDAFKGSPRLADYYRIIVRSTRRLYFLWSKCSPSTSPIFPLTAPLTVSSSTTKLQTNTGIIAYTMFLWTKQKFLIKVIFNYGHVIARWKIRTYSYYKVGTKCSRRDEEIKN